LEAKITEQKEEAEKREKILTDHLKERTNDLNQLEAEFSQQERKLEDEIITLKIQLEEAKRKKEVMRNQMMKKEEEVEKLEEEVVMLRVEVVKLNKNIEEASTSSVKIVEEKCHRSSEGKSEENPKSYAEVIKGSIKKEEYKPLKKNIPKGQKTQEEEYIRDGYQRRPSAFRQPRSFTHNEGVNRREDVINQSMISEGLQHREDHPLPGM
jgi:chromosome segregation ATPase